MHIVFSGLDGDCGKRNRDYSEDAIDRQIQRDLWASYENGQMLAFAKWLALNTSVVPFFILEKNSELADELKEAQIGLLEVNPRINFFDKAAIWRWQRKIADLHIVSYGRDQNTLARYLAKLGDKQKQLVNSFYYTPGEADQDNLSGKRNYLCASGLVVSQINELLRNMKMEFVESARRTFLPGLNWQAYIQAEPWQPEKKRFVFGMGGSLLPDSGALEIVRAMAAIWQKEDLPPWEVRLFGAGSALGKILEEAKKLGVSSRLSILSSQPLEEVAQYCHCWLAPGYAEAETPDCLWAGFAAGLPVICADTPLHKDWMPWAETPAFLVPPQNPQQLAHAMIKIMKDHQLRENLAKKGLGCRNDLGLDKMSERIWSILKNLLSLE